MASRHIPDEDLLDRLADLAAYGSVTEAAKVLGMPRSTFRDQIRMANNRGLDGSVPHPIPLGQSIKGTSTLYDKEGNTVMQWVKTQADRQQEDLIDAITEVFDRYAGAAKLVTPPTAPDEDLVTVYPIADHHLGLYAWAREAGEDYDLDIGAKLLRSTMARLVSESPSSDTAVVLNLGDFFHADNTSNQTARSGNALDVDTRYAKVLEVGVQLLVDCIELALQRHQNVIVRCLQGNHDEHSAVALSAALSAFFRNEDRVTVDMSPALFWFWRFGQVLLGATHGHMAKPKDMAGIMAALCPKDWGATQYRYIYTGHIHHQTRLEHHGVITESLQTLAARDAWHAAAGYFAGRSMCAISHHRYWGEIERRTVNVPRQA